MNRELIFTTETKNSSLTLYLKTSGKEVEASTITISKVSLIDEVIDLDLSYQTIYQLYTSIQTLTIYDDYSKSKNRFSITLTDDDYNCQYIGEAFDFMYEKILKVVINKIPQMNDLIIDLKNN